MVDITGSIIGTDNSVFCQHRAKSADTALIIFQWFRVCLIQFCPTGKTKTNPKSVFFSPFLQGHTIISSRY